MKGPNIPPRLPPQLELPVDLAVALMDAAASSLQRTLRAAQRTHRAGRGETLKPGAATPLWNELAAAIRTQLTRRGEKARLARILGLPRQRIHDLLRARSSLPDAERTLLLLVWLQARQEGRDLA